ncbi:hypothetical protein RFI_00573 [Reticulomyxa filosa]|uniref:Uncharacterized protein n=1 Tax=Reticulomyxa filosa TaxID=46433 RepID=X6PE53_RETFI|nr:hypothetical protein RFI_00573 [Reticulomyxa filosa]|eukprot:ETO36491.1 hypothetical protein RFI_00573 [Reticulomyxa filosa]
MSFKTCTKEEDRNKGQNDSKEEEAWSDIKTNELSVSSLLTNDEIAEAGQQSPYLVSPTHSPRSEASGLHSTAEREEKLEEDQWDIYNIYSRIDHLHSQLLERHKSEKRETLAEEIAALKESGMDILMYIKHHQRFKPALTNALLWMKQFSKCMYGTMTHFGIDSVEHMLSDLWSFIKDGMVYLDEHPKNNVMKLTIDKMSEVIEAIQSMILLSQYLLRSGSIFEFLKTKEKQEKQKNTSLFLSFLFVHISYYLLSWNFKFLFYFLVFMKLFYFILHFFWSDIL